MSTLPDPDALQRTQMQPTGAVAQVSNEGAVGNAVAHFGADVVQMSQQIQQHLDGTYAQNALNQLRQKALDLQMRPPVDDNGAAQEPGYLLTKGAKAAGADGNPSLLDTVPKQLEDFATGLKSKLSPGAAQTFDAHAQELQTNFKAGVLQHVMQQTVQFQNDNDDRTFGQFTQAAAQYAATNPAASEAYRVAAQEVQTQRMKRAGVPEADLASAIIPAMSHLNSGIVEALLDSHKSQEAALFMTAHPDDFTKDDYLRNQKLITHFGDLQTAQHTVDNAIGLATKDVGSGRKISESDAFAKIEGLQDMTPETREQTTALVRQSVSQWNQNIDIKENNVLKNAQTWADLHPGVPFARAPAQLRSDIIAHAPDKLATMNAYTDALTPNADGGTKVQTNLVAYSRMIENPGILAKMSDADFNYFTKTQLAPAQQIHAATLRGEALSGKIADSPDSLNPIVNQAIDSRLRDIGFNPSANPDKDKDEAHRVAQIRSTIVEGLYAQQKQEGQKLNERDAVAAVNKAFDMTQSKPSFFEAFGANPSTSPILSVKKVSEIPDAEVQVIKTKLKSSGILDPSDDEIIHVYQKGQLYGKRR